MILFAARASSILHDLLRSCAEKRPFLIPANACPVIPVTFLEASHPFALVDIADPTLAMDPEACLGRLRREPGKFGGILFVRPYGSERDVDPFFRQLKELQSDLLLIDDKCLCRPDCEGSRVSPWADVTLFSTGRVKHVDLGYGGFAHVREGVPYRRGNGEPYRETALEEVTRRYKKAMAEGSPFAGTCHGWLDLRVPETSWEEHRRHTAAALQRADEHKRRLNAIYADALPQEIQMAPELQSWRFNIRVPEPEKLVQRLFAAGLFASRHYASLRGTFSGDHFPQAEKLHQRIVNLFNDRYFSEEQAERAVSLILEHLADPAQQRRAERAPEGSP